MASTFRCRLVTPAARLFDEPVSSAVVPMWDGLMGFLPGRAPILGKLGIGELKLEFAGNSQAAGNYFIDGGVLQMAENELTILAERATPVSELNATEAEAQLSKIENDRVSIDDPSRDAKNKRRDREIRSASEKIRLARGQKIA
ncbi:MAG: F0F1 ATP synthase subunit epsilon [Phycisphaeraceae bacterium]|nr:F0F1 ATP synthase subunit epsilon [Phycisphaeraceae bacterium]